MKNLLSFIVALMLVLTPVSVCAVTEEEAIKNEDLQYYRFNNEVQKGGNGTAYEKYYLSAPSVTHRSDYAKYDIYEGVDVSYHQGTVDFNKVKADGIDFVILRVGYRGYGTGKLMEDTKFATYAKAAKAAGLDVGAYFFTQAITVAEAKAEAEFVLSLIKDYDLTLPIAYDIENYPASYEARLDEKLATFTNTSDRKTFCTSLALSFCDTIQKGGYKAMTYANKNWLTNYLYNTNISDLYQIWLAHYTTATNYTGEYNYWQCAETATVNGISTKADYDFFYARKPDKVSQVNIGSKTATSTTLSWKGSVRATDYKISVFDKAGKLVNNYYTDKTTYTVTGLSSGEEYKFTVNPYFKMAGKTYYAENGVDVKLNKASLTIGIGESFSLSAKVSNSNVDYSLSWKTSTKRYATVSNGTVKGIDEGTATITVTDDISGSSDSCEVTVKKAPTSVSLSNKQVYISPGQSFGLTSYVNSGAASYKREYTSSTPSVATVSKTDGVIIAKSYGTTTVTVSTYNGKRATCNVTVVKPPEITKIDIVDNKIKLYWGGVDGAAKYKVYRSLDGNNFTYLSTTSRTYLLNTTIIAGQKYYYKISAVYDGYEGGLSNEKSAIVLKAPTISKIELLNGKIKLYWNAIEGAEKYKIYRSTDGVNFKYFSSTNKDYFLNTTVNSGQMYYYKISALYSSEGKSLESGLSSYKSMLSLDKPDVYKISTVNGKIKLYWNEVSGADKYKIYRSTDGVNFKYFSTTSANTFLNTTVTQGQIYYYKIRAIKAYGGVTYNGSLAGIFSQVAMKTPVISSISRLSNGIKISWGKIEGADKYKIYRSTDGVNFKYYTSTTKTSYTNSATLKGRKYYYKVAAVNAKYGEEYTTPLSLAKTKIA